MRTWVCCLLSLRFSRLRSILPFFLSRMERKWSSMKFPPTGDRNVFSTQPSKTGVMVVEEPPISTTTAVDFPQAYVDITASRPRKIAGAARGVGGGMGGAGQGWGGSARETSPSPFHSTIHSPLQDSNKTSASLLRCSGEAKHLSMNIKGCSDATVESRNISDIPRS